MTRLESESNRSKCKQEKREASVSEGEGEEEESFATGITKIDHLMGTDNGRLTNVSSTVK